MSRIGKVPVVLPSGVTVQVRDGSMIVSGKKGRLARPVPGPVKVDVAEGRVVLSLESEDRRNLVSLFVTYTATWR